MTVLNDAVGAIARRLALKSRRELVDLYKTGHHTSELDSVLRDIGMKAIGFDEVRTEGVGVNDFPSRYGFPPPVVQQTQPAGNSGAQPSGTGAQASHPGTGQTSTAAAASPTASSPSVSSRRGKTKAVAVNDPRSVYRKLRAFAPRGKGREKLATLLEEAGLLRLEKHPHSFCFLLRSMFELSAKAYAKDHPVAGIKIKKSDGTTDRPLIDVLRDVADHLTEKRLKTNPLTKTLHGAMAELANEKGFLSIISLNQLVHNPTFIVTEKDICPVFARVFPLLEEMNR